MFLSHPQWVASIELIHVNPTIMCLDGIITGIFDPLISFDSFVHIGSISPTNTVVPTEWISPCTVDNKPKRPIQCRIRENGQVEIFLSFKSGRSFTVDFNCVLIQSSSTTLTISTQIDQCVVVNNMCGGIFKLSGSIIAPVFWDSSFYQFKLKLETKLRPATDLQFPILCSNNWFVCKIYTDGRIVVETTTIRTTDNPVVLDSVWWCLADDTIGTTVAVCRIQLQNIKTAILPYFHRPKRNQVFYALNHIESSSEDLLAPGAPGNLVQLEVTNQGTVFANDNVMINTSVFMRIDSDPIVLDRSKWMPIWQTWLTIPDLKAMAASICIGIEEFAQSLSRDVNGRFDTSQLRKLLIDKKVAMLKNDTSDHQTCAWIRASSRPVAPGQLGLVSDHIAKTVTVQFIPVLEKVKKFLTSKLPEHEDLMELPDIVFAGPSDVCDPYVPPPPLGGWMISGRKCAHQIRLAKNALPDELTSLYRIINWFDQYSTMESQLTHSSFLGNQDIFTNTGKWKIPDDPEIQNLLFKNMAWIYKHGYDTFISEIQTPVFPFIEDIDCESTIPMSDTKLIDEIFLGEKFLAERARALKIIYPHINEFRCHIYSSSGFNKSKGRWKSSFHLVWPDIVVDGRLAPIIRQTAVEYFLYKTSTCSFFKRMQYRLMNHFDANIWENVFDQTTSNCMNGLRMPFSNKASWVKTSTGGAAMKYPKVEDRHCFPRGTVVITIEEKNTVSRELAMKRLVDAQGSFEPMKDQNSIVHDRTQYKSIDKNTINRTSAFFKAMKAIGGDTVGDLSVTTKWVEQVENPKSLTDEEIFLWIKRGSCRRGGLTTSDLTRFNEVFVEEFETADLDIFEGHTLESLRRTDIWAKMTPAAQAGIKTRFRKYLLKKSMKVMGKREEDVRCDEDVMVEEEQEQEEQEQDEDVLEGEELSPPVNNEVELFDEIGTDLDFIWKYTGTVNEFERQLRSALKLTNSEGYWIHTQVSVSWISERESRSNGWGSFLDVYSNDQRTVKPSVSVSYYYHCGKVVISGHNSSKTYMFILKAIKSFCEPDDGLYHKLILPQMSEDSFPLLDEDDLIEQREEYRARWLCMKSIV